MYFDIPKNKKIKNIFIKAKIPIQHLKRNRINDIKDNNIKEEEDDIENNNIKKEENNNIEEEEEVVEYRQIMWKIHIFFQELLGAG